MKTIALFLHQPRCSVQSSNGIIQALSPHYKFKIFTRHEVERDFFDDVDAVCIPGGIGDADSFDYLLRDNGQRVQEFVAKGGAYLGICMGAYWAGKNYFNLLQGVNPVQYMTRPGTDTHRPHAKNMPVTWKDEPMNMFWYDGCSFVGDETNFQTIARYRGNSDPMAIVQGRIGLIGCHPESTPHWYLSYSWLKEKYHNGHHHKLLLEFVDHIMEDQ
jgi:glutamine amidotransferase-like uncharacterized protein